MPLDLAPYFDAAQSRSSTDPAHDYLHVQRVFHNAQLILAETPADADVVLVAVLLHELFNYPKGHPDSARSGDVCAEYAATLLEEHAFPVNKRDLVLDCIRNHSFSKGVVPSHWEGKIVQDADRLDSLGAIGIARCFATSQAMQRPFYHEFDPFAENRTPDDKQYGIDHFYVKLLKLADGMHTGLGRRLASDRTYFMRQYLAQLARELSKPAQ